MSLHDWQVNARDADRRLVGVIDDYDRLELVLRFNLPGSWVLHGANVDDDVVAALASARAGLVVDMDGVPVFSGPRLSYRRERLTREGFTHNLVTVGGADDAVWLWRRRVLPQPADAEFDTDSHDVRTGAAETVMHGYVNANAGPGALSWRRVDGLVLGADLGRGDDVTERGRLQKLGDLLTSIAIKGGGLGFNVVQDEDDLVFAVFDPVDRSGSIEISDDVGNLGDFVYEIEAPTGNAGWVGGADELTARTFVHRADSDSIATWGRVEFFRNRTDTDDDAELTQEGDEEIATNGERVKFEIGAVDLANLSYGTDYGLGDLVTAVVDGVPVVQVIREVQIDVSRETETITPVLGTPGVEGTTDVVAAVFDQIKRLDRRVTNEERR